jgi:hypothetical protein
MQFRKHLPPETEPDTMESSQSPRPELDRPVSPAVKTNPLLVTIRQPWLRWFAAFTAGAVIIAAIVLTRPDVGAWFSSHPTHNPSAQTASAATPAESLPQIIQAGVQPVISRNITSHSTEPADFRADVVTYTVQPGDYLFGIADNYKIKPETIL